MSSRIAVLGSGMAGQVLASGFLKHGHEVTIGTRNPGKLEGWLDKNAGGKVASPHEAAANADMIVLAAKGTVAQEMLTLAKAENLRGKIIIDATNPIADAPPENGVLKYFTTLDDSLMERLQRAFPQGRFVKAFNSVGNAYMVEFPDFGGTKPTMFICGNDPAAKKEVTAILEAFGWEAEDMGGVEGARAIEPLCMLWCIPGFQRNQWTHAFKLLKK